MVASKRLRIAVLYSGRVQGVGFRYTAKSLAQEFDVTGLVRNLSDGRVELIVEGLKEELESYLQSIRDSGLGPCVRDEKALWCDASGEFRGFEIVR